MAMSAIMRREAADDRLLVTGTIACLAVGAALLHFFAPINHDEAYFMALAGRLLDGGQFGKDIMDMNPPHVWWISAMPVWLARQTGLRLDVAAAVFTVDNGRTVGRCSCAPDRGSRPWTCSPQPVPCLCRPPGSVHSRLRFRAARALDGAAHPALHRRARLPSEQFSGFTGHRCCHRGGCLPSAFVSSPTSCWCRSRLKSGYWREHGGQVCQSALRQSPWRSPALSTEHLR